MNFRSRLSAALLLPLLSCSTRSTPTPTLLPLHWPASATLPLTSTALGASNRDYLAQVAIGAQTFTLVADTGSPAVVVASARCSDCDGVSPLYTPGPTGVDTGATSTGNYGDQGGLVAEIYEDQVGLGGGTPAVPINIAAVLSQQALFREDGVQGILGLGPKAGDFGDTTAYTESAAATTAPARLTFELCDGAGTMWIGDYDTSKQASPPQYTPLVPASSGYPYYNLMVSDIGIGGTSLGFGSETYSHAFLDTGTVESYLPAQPFQALVSAVNRSAGVASLFPGQQLSANSNCLTSSTATNAQVDSLLPAMSTTFPAVGGGAFTVSAPPTRSYLVAEPNGVWCLHLGDSSSLGLGAGYTDLGAGFMRAFITVHDLTNHQIGFARDVGCASH